MRLRWIFLLGFGLQILLTQIVIAGVYLQPLLILILVLAYRMTPNAILLTATASGLLTELLSSGSHGEILGVYLLLGMGLSGLRRHYPSMLEFTGNLLALLMLFVTGFGLSALVEVEISSVPVASALLYEIAALLVVSAIPLVILHKLMMRSKER